MLVLAIAGGIILALVLLPFLGPLAIIAIIAAMAISAIVTVVFIIQRIKDTAEEHRQEEDRLAKLPEKEREAEIQKKREKQHKQLRIRILVPVITFAFFFVIVLFAAGFDLEGEVGFAIFWPAVFAIIALIFVIAIQKYT